MKKVQLNVMISFITRVTGLVQGTELKIAFSVGKVKSERKVQKVKSRLCIF